MSEYKKTRKSENGLVREISEIIQHKIKDPRIEGTFPFTEIDFTGFGMRKFNKRLGIRRKKTRLWRH